MIQISAEFLALISEAAVLVQHGRISFANSPAQSILGGDCVGKSVKAVFGEDVAGVQASYFTGDVPLGKGRYIIRLSKINDITAIFMTDACQMPELLSNAFFYYLRTCLMGAGIAVEAARLRGEALDDHEILTQLSRINHNYYKLRRVTQNAEIVRRVHEGNMVFSSQQFDLTLLIQTLVDALRLLFTQPELRLNPCPPVYVNADPILIKQMLMNLISNCLSHAQGCSRVSINIMDCGERVIISVDDDGCGISPEEMHKVFDRFRHEYQLSELCRGAGLGLTAVRYIARLHGGALLLESKEGRGTTARVSVKKCISSPGLRSGQASYELSTADLLVGMADALLPERFSEQYSD